ncbi:MAG: hypothetical protein P8Z75_12350 [Gammaproteobacteria bacterium]
MKLTLLFLSALVVLCLALLLLRLWDWRADHAEWTRLVAFQPTHPPRFDPAMVNGLPEPAQRYFRFAIAPGTPLLPVAEIDMGGEFSLGNRDAPNYRRMQAQQILAAPHGFIWQMQLPGWLPVSGSDAGSPTNSWTRFRILGLIPVARMGGDQDHLRSAFGRYVAEAVFWTPAALLPQPGITWQGINHDTARVTVSTGSLSQSVDVKLSADGQPISVSFMRWSNANPEKRYRLQPFGGKLSDFRQVQGYRLPFRVEAGNMFGTDAYFAFFRAEVSAIRFPGGGL